MVSQGAVVFMAISGAIAFLLPIGLIVWFKRRYGASLKVFLLALSRFCLCPAAGGRRSCLCTASE